jgi:hypothetical protein
VAAIAERNQVLTDIREYRRWCPALARYSFHTQKLTNAPPPASGRRPNADTPSIKPTIPSPSVKPDVPQRLTMLFYLVCDISGSPKTDLHALNQSLGLMRRALAAEPSVDSIARMCVISFAGSAEIVLPMGSTGRPVPLLKGVTEDADYGAAFSLLGKTAKDDLFRFGERNFKVCQPCVFFFTFGVPGDRRWAAAFKRTLTLNPEKWSGMGEHPIFIPVGIGDAPQGVLRRLAYPPGKSDWHHASQSKMEDILGAAIKAINTLPSATPGIDAEDWI